jgi:hypothetical protein
MAEQSMKNKAIADGMSAGMTAAGELIESMRQKDPEGVGPMQEIFINLLATVISTASVDATINSIIGDTEL